MILLPWRSGRILEDIKGQKSDRQDIPPSPGVTTSTQMITLLDLEKSVSCLADFVLSAILADETPGKKQQLGRSDGQAARGRVAVGGVSLAAPWGGTKIGPPAPPGPTLVHHV